MKMTNKKNVQDPTLVEKLISDQIVVIGKWASIAVKAAFLISVAFSILSNKTNRDLKVRYIKSIPGSFINSDSSSSRLEALAILHHNWSSRSLHI